MIASQSSRLERYLLSCELFTPEQVTAVLERRRSVGGSLTEIIVLEELAGEEEYLQALAKTMNLRFEKPGDSEIDSEVLLSLPTKAVFQYKVIPFAEDDKHLDILINDPFRAGVTDALRLAAGKRVRFVLCPLADIEKVSKKFYGVGGETIDAIMASDLLDLENEIEDPNSGNLDELDEEASIVKFVNQIIWEAHKDRATDIHMEPMEKDLRIRYRIDGVLHQTPVPPALKRFQSAIISRIKVMSNMDIAEKRLPQDGRISVRIKGEEIDIRVSTMPTVYGESISLRLLLRGSAMLGMQHLGLGGKDEEILTKLINRPHGIILVTGPTGSGKSTSLYAYLHTINSVDKRLITVEDPIEYQMAGVNQIQMRPEIGLTFAVGLRHILRQDPDVIMVGEIRDKETADIAIQASLTGHLVFSTLHTNDSAGGVTRLIDMGIEPFLVASSIEALIAQRLVRRLCKECRRPFDPDRVVLEAAGFPMDELDKQPIYEPVGCEACRGSGFSGRTGIYEVLIMSDKIRGMVTAREASVVIKNEALREGMKTLRDDGWLKVINGVTTIEEVLRVTEEDDDSLSEA